ncbi:conserved protein of unknown function [Georgfuchsia toluolica]|uniref:Uncharacterized protein n=1 Tax=Georgfuchsia toluolica TaxID=424218 RepID=A0A916J3U1_9PROT|nr:hypothetical protein [Georgfuchsia toluolica]CAG4883679.1 conserved protein of unknown function [Georgfuchsia toluolica]
MVNVIPIHMAPSAAMQSAVSVHNNLVRDGWIRQMLICEPRLSELVDTYKKLGYEVRVEDYVAADGDGNAPDTAGGDSGQQVRALYVRKIKASEGDDKSL